MGEVQFGTNQMRLFIIGKDHILSHVYYSFNAILLNLLSYYGCNFRRALRQGSEYLVLDRGGARNFPRGGLTPPTRGLKFGFQGSVNAKNLRQNSFSPSDGRLACSDRGL